MSLCYHNTETAYCPSCSADQLRGLLGTQYGIGHQPTLEQRLAKAEARIKQLEWVAEAQGFTIRKEQ